MLNKQYEFDLKPFDNDIPDSWNLVPLEKAGDVVYGIQASVANNIKPIGTKILTNKNITIDGQINLEKINYFELTTDRHFKTILKKGDLLFNWRSGSKEHVGKTAFFDLDGEYTHSSFILRIRTNHKVERWFLYFYLNYLRVSNYFLKLQTYAINAKFNKSALNRLPVILPPLDEQKRIAYVLSTVQKAIAQQEQIIQTTTELKKALMHKLFTKGLHGEKQKETDIGLIPESWDVARLDSITEDFQYGTSVKCDYNIDGVPVLRIPNVVGGHVDTNDLKFGNPKPSEIENLPLQHGDLLFVRTNGVRENAGRCSMYRGELGDSCYYASYLIRVRLPQEMLNSEFLEEYSRTEIGTSFLSGQSIRTADGKFNINSGTLKRMLLPKPDIEEQREIANVARF